MGLTVAAAARCLTATSVWEVLGAPPQDTDGLDEFVTSASDGPASGAIGVFVEDSDYAYVVFAKGGRLGRALIGSKLARDYQQGRAALEYLNEQIGHPSSLFVNWARALGFDVSLQTVEDIMGREWTCAENGVQALVELVRLPDLLGPSTSELPGEATMLLLGKASLGRWHLGKLSIGRRSFDFSAARYVAGYGKGFVGVWDLHNPAHPVKRFERGQEGLAVRAAIEMETRRARRDASDVD